MGSSKTMEIGIQELENGFILLINGKNLVAKNVTEVLGLIKKELSQKKNKSTKPPEGLIKREQ